MIDTSQGGGQPKAKWRVYLRRAFGILAALSTMALGGVLAVFGAGLFWAAFLDLRSGGLGQYWVQIGHLKLTLEGWKVYAVAFAATGAALVVIALGWSLLPRRRHGE